MMHERGKSASATPGGQFHADAGQDFPALSQAEVADLHYNHLLYLLLFHGPDRVTIFVRRLRMLHSFCSSPPPAMRGVTSSPKPICGIEIESGAPGIVDGVLVLERAQLARTKLAEDRQESFLP
jgi:hypothetical protein